MKNDQNQLEEDISSILSGAVILNAIVLDNHALSAICTIVIIITFIMLIYIKTKSMNCIDSIKFIGTNIYLMIILLVIITMIMRFIH